MRLLWGHMLLDIDQMINGTNLGGLQDTIWDFCRLTSEIGFSDVRQVGASAPKNTFAELGHPGGARP